MVTTVPEAVEPAMTVVGGPQPFEEFCKVTACLMAAKGTGVSEMSRGVISLPPNRTIWFVF